MTQQVCVARSWTNRDRRLERKIPICGRRPTSAPWQVIRRSSGFLSLPTHQAIESPTLRLRKPARTFFGTRIHAPKKVCHDGDLLICLTRDG